MNGRFRKFLPYIALAMVVLAVGAIIYTEGETVPVKRLVFGLLLLGAILFKKPWRGLGVRSAVRRMAAHEDEKRRNNRNL